MRARSTSIRLCKSMASSMYSCSRETLSCIYPRSLPFHTCAAHRGCAMDQGAVSQRCLQHCHGTQGLHHAHIGGTQAVSFGQSIDGFVRTSAYVGDSAEEPGQVERRWAEDLSLTSTHTAAISPACPGLETNNADFHSDEPKGKKKWKDILWRLNAHTSFAEAFCSLAAYCRHA